jgi:adenine/guanine phosphoribosyltransferase-like PRPP-binding protein
MQHQFLSLTWNEFDEAAAELAGIVSRDAPGIYGEPRGGLPLAVALSHRTGLPLLREPQAGMVWVDDIVDRGQTLQARRGQYADCQFVAWLARGVHAGVHAARIIDSDEWVIFPWECQERAKAERDAYALSRLPKP